MMHHYDYAIVCVCALVCIAVHQFHHTTTFYFHNHTQEYNITHAVITSGVNETTELLAQSFDFIMCCLAELNVFHVHQLIALPGTLATAQLAALSLLLQLRISHLYAWNWAVKALL